MFEVNYCLCCAVKELKGIAWTRPLDLENSLKVFMRARVNRGRFDCAFVMFSEAIIPQCLNPSHYAQPLVDYITEHKLGTVTKSIPKRNPNTGAIVTVFLWEIKPNITMKWLRGRAR